MLIIQVQALLVVVVRHLQFNHPYRVLLKVKMLRNLTLMMLFLSSFTWADAISQSVAIQPLKTNLQANITLHSLEELKQLLLQTEKISNGTSEVEYGSKNPIAVVLHGDEIGAFVRSNYRIHKELVDLAARLDAFKIIEVKVCQKWMGENDIKVNELPPFVEAVPVGAKERKRLEKAGYAYF